MKCVCQWGTCDIGFFSSIANAKLSKCQKSVKGIPVKVIHNKQWRRNLNATIRRDERRDSIRNKRKLKLV